MDADSLAARPVSSLKGVGPRVAEQLARLDIQTVQDLLFHLPTRYQDRSRITPIGSLQPGQDAVIEGKVLLADVVYGRRRSLLVKIEDSTGIVSARFFYFTPAQRANLERGANIRCFGETRRGASGLEFYHPEYRVSAQELPPLSGALTAVYPTTEGVNQKKLRQLALQAIDQLQENSLSELLEATSREEGYASLEQALRFLHCPPAADTTERELHLLQMGQHPAQQRLILEELTAHQASFLALRKQKRKRGAPPLDSTNGFEQTFLKRLGFQLTGAQQRVANEIQQDLNKSQPMLRLVQGDVGSGKTVIAALAALQAVSAGFQVAIMAPTEILAEQHFNSFSQWLEPLGIRVGWLSGKLTKAQRNQATEELASGNTQIAIGTHALFQETVQFGNLGLVIIDEQHRFGVHQRLSLRAKGESRHSQPHQLIMTATPIPRTLTMSAYADLDCSIIDELPPGRSPVETVVISNQRRSEIIERVAQVCENRQQVYWVCTLIEESEVLQCEAAENTTQQLRALLPGLTIGLLHGRLKSEEKATIMAAFKRGEINMLVATTVIEVGVDVPNATLMVIENSERLGLAQLHQLRGRIGRGREQSYCVLLYQPKLSALAKERLAVMREYSDGFIIAEKDLSIRGPGEVLGTRQAGLVRFKIADLERDNALLPKARSIALQLLRENPTAITALIQRWLGQNAQYGQV